MVVVPVWRTETVQVSSATGATKWPVLLQRGMHLGAHPQRSLLPASPVLIEGSTLTEGSVRSSKKGCQIGLEGRLIAFDGEDTMASQRVNPLHELVVSMKRVGRTHPSSQGRAGKSAWATGISLVFSQTATCKRVSWLWWVRKESR